QLGITRDVDRHLADPLHVERDQPPEQLLRLSRPGDRVVVEEEEPTRAERAELLDVGDDVVDRPRPEGAVVVGLDRAVLAGMRAGDWSGRAWARRICGAIAVMPTTSDSRSTCATSRSCMSSSVKVTS